jgi:hypothetical protein
MDKLRIPGFTAEATIGANCNRYSGNGDYLAPNATMVQPQFCHRDILDDGGDLIYCCDPETGCRIVGPIHYI